jgi:hypothetical protein
MRITRILIGIFISHLSSRKELSNRDCRGFFGLNDPIRSGINSSPHTHPVHLRDSPDYQKPASDKNGSGQMGFFQLHDLWRISLPCIAGEHYIVFTR